MSQATVEGHLAPMRRPEIDAAVRPLLRGLVLPEAMQMARGVYRRRRLTVPTLVVFGRQDQLGRVRRLGRRAGLWMTLWCVRSDRGGLAGHDDVPDEVLPEVLHDSDNLARSMAGGSQSGSQANRRRWTTMDPLSTIWNPVGPG